MITIKEIASELGISPMTVSNVLNNKRNKVSEQTYKMVMALVKEKGYVPDASAISLRSGKSRIIAVWLPSSEQKNLLEIPYISSITSTIARYANQIDYHIMLFSTQSVVEFHNSVKSWGVDAAIAFGISSTMAEEVNQQLSIPIVFLDSYVECPEVYTINSDDEHGAYCATKHLIERGHSQIAFVSGKEVYSKEQLQANGILYHRFLGYSKAIEEAGLKTIVCGDEISFEGGVEIGMRLGCANPEQITAIFCTADEMVVGVKEGLESQGKRIPDDFSLIGFDNLPFTSYTSPKLTTVQQQSTEKARLAIDSLLKLLGKQEVQAQQVLPVQLVLRQSVIDL